LRVKCDRDDTALLGDISRHLPDLLINWLHEASGTGMIPLQQQSHSVSFSEEYTPSRPKINFGINQRPAACEPANENNPPYSKNPVFQ